MAKRIFKNKRYTVERYENDGETLLCGILEGSDVQAILKGFKYDEMFGMYFDNKASVGYFVEEVLKGDIEL